MKRNIVYRILVIWVLVMLWGLSISMSQFYNLLLLSIAGFIQNMAFTMVSRSRNSGNPERHRYAAWASNGIWAFCFLFLVASVTEPLNQIKNTPISQWMWSDIREVLITLLVYTLVTAEGSVFMMRMNLGQVKLGALSKLFTEKGKSQVGKRN